LEDFLALEASGWKGQTRSAAAVELWRKQLAGSIVAIGNAPTALFHLLEMIAAGAARPALVLGFPVGFVGAAEAKAALAANRLGLDTIETGAMVAFSMAQ
jgi:precorrin-8X/cobalt-precorrin-8 methylmutase